MTLVYSGGHPLTLVRQRGMHSFDTDMHSIGFATSMASYVSSRGAFSMDPDDIWRTQPSVRTVTDFIARNVAKVHQRIYTSPLGEEFMEAHVGPMRSWLDQPCKGVTNFRFIRDLELDRLLWGRYFAPLVRVNGQWQAIRIRPRYWRFKTEYGHPCAVVLATGVELPLDDAIVSANYASDELSPIEALTAMLEEEAESSAYRRSLWAETSRIPGFLRRPADAEEWSTEVKNSFIASWAEYKRTGSKTGRTPILEDGMEYIPLTPLSPADGQQVEWRKLTRSEVAAYFHVPPSYVGVMDNANYSNMKEAGNLLNTNVLLPEFIELEQIFNLCAIPLIQPNARIEFDIDGLSEAERMRLYSRAIGGSWITPAEGRKDLRLPFLAGTDKLVQAPNAVAADRTESLE